MMEVMSASFCICFFSVLSSTSAVVAVRRGGARAAAFGPFFKPLRRPFADPVGEPGGAGEPGTRITLYVPVESMQAMTGRLDSVPETRRINESLLQVDCMGESTTGESIVSNDPFDGHNIGGSRISY